MNTTPVNRELATQIAENSPVYHLQFLKTGWDGYWADPLSQAVILKADWLWQKIELVTNNNRLPVIRAAANGSVVFTWTQDYPKKELEIWLYDRPDYYAEWMISLQDVNSENISSSQPCLLDIIEEYQKL